MLADELILRVVHSSVFEEKNSDKGGPSGNLFGTPSDYF